MQMGLCSDLSENNSEERVRRFGEVAQVLLRTGQIVVSTTNTFSLAQHQIIRTLVHPYPVLTVHLSFTPEPLPEGTDLGFVCPWELAAPVLDILGKMAELGILP